MLKFVLKNLKNVLKNDMILKGFEIYIQILKNYINNFKKNFRQGYIEGYSYKIFAIKFDLMYNCSSTST